MLVLTRDVGQRVFLELPSGERIIVDVADIDGRRQVRLRFTAPRDVVILREELVDRAEQKR